MVNLDYVYRLKQSHPILAGFFEKYWETPLGEYSKGLYFKQITPFEKELEEAFVEEWQELGYELDSAEKFLKDLKSQPVLQTSHHVTPTNGPTFLAFDLISLTGLPKDAIYFVAANSGVAFSNAAWSGALSYERICLTELLDNEKPLFKRTLKALQDRKQDGTFDRRISLIPSKQRDQLVFGTTIQLRQVEIYDQFSERLKSLIPNPGEQQPYSTWACLVCSKLQETIFNRKNIVYFDINRVISRYLVKILLNNPHHPVVNLLFDKGTSDAFNKAFDHPNVFLSSYHSKKSTKIETLSWENSSTIGLKSGDQKYDKESLAKALLANKICPGIILQFFVLRFINNIKCLGSFNQVEYLEEHRKKWQALNLPWEVNLSPDEGIALTTGRMVKEGKALWPLDMVWKQQRIRLEELRGLPMSEFWSPIVGQLVT
jgi:hypothetical protein